MLVHPCFFFQAEDEIRDDLVTGVKTCALRTTAADGVAAAVLVAGARAHACCERPAWIRGIDHRIEAHSLGARDLTRARSAEIAAHNAGVSAGRVDVAEIDAPFSHQEILVRDALGLDPSTVINPSGGALA